MGKPNGTPAPNAQIAYLIEPLTRREPFATKPSMATVAQVIADALHEPGCRYVKGEGVLYPDATGVWHTLPMRSTLALVFDAAMALKYTAKNGETVPYRPAVQGLKNGIEPIVMSKIAGQPLGEPRGLAIGNVLYTVDAGRLVMRAIRAADEVAADRVCPITPAQPGDTATPAWDRLFAAQWTGEQRQLNRRAFEVWLTHALLGEVAKRLQLPVCLIIGAKNSGKSELIDATAEVFAASVRASVPLCQLGGRWAGGALQGKMLNIATETSSKGFGPDELAIFKSLTTNDSIPIEKKYRDPMRGQIPCGHLGSGNVLVRGLDDAGMRRIVLFLFPNTIPAEAIDRDLPGKLRAELPQLLRRLLDGAAAAVRDGMPPRPWQEGHKAVWRAVEDDVATWAQEQDGDGWTHANELHEHYTAWSKARCVKPKTRIPFTKALRAMGIEESNRRIDGRKGRVFALTLIEQERATA